jgi:hypothetical protein
MPIFGHLDTLPIRISDESRLAINAHEMLQNKNYLVTHFEGKPVRSRSINLLKNIIHMKSLVLAKLG